MEADTFVGVWTNWDRGRILVLTLTISRSYGIVLIAAVALIVKWAGSRAWGIICFLLHLRQSDHKSHDGLHYQYQALLRSKLPETDFLWRLYELSCAWRTNTPRAFLRSFPLGLLALINLIGFLVAGIFSSWVTEAESQGLLTGLCGDIVSVADKDFSLWTQDDWAAGDALFITAYNGYRDLLQLYEVPHIESVIDYNAKCPFAEPACAGPTIAMDSGLINANSHLGINVPPNDNLQIRKVTTCVPFNMDAFSSGWTDQLQPVTEAFLGVTPPGDRYQYYSLGPSMHLGVPYSNFTFVVSNYSLLTPGLPYTFNIRTAFAKNVYESGFFPDAALNRTDADVSILTLNNRVAYTGQVDDPFFSATLPVGGNGVANTYLSNSTLTGIGCTEAYQYCNPSLPDSISNKCSQLASLYEFDAVKPPENLQLNARQHAIYRIQRLHFYYLRFWSFVSLLRNEILVADKLIWGSFGLSTPLPDNQWQQEVANIHNITMAGLQLQQVYFAAVPNMQVRPGLVLHDYIVPRTDPDELFLCRNQRARVTGYSSFNMFGICTILCASLVIFLLDIFLPTVMHRLPHLFSKKESFLDAWREDDILQIQRIALESRGIGPWKDTKGDVPVTTGWKMKFRRGRSQAKSKADGSQMMDSLERLNNAEHESEIELAKTPAISVTKL